MKSTDAQDPALPQRERGVARALAGDLAAALADFDEALRVAPGSPKTLISRGAARAQAGDLDGAVADFTAALRLDPGLAEAYNNRAAVRLTLWDFDGAIADLDAALTLDPRHCPAHLMRAQARYHKRDVADGEADLRAAFALDAAFTARLLVGQIAGSMRQNPRAVLRDCEHHLRDNPADFHSLARRGLVRVLQADEAAARPEFERYRLLNPGGAAFLDLLIVEARRWRDAAGPGPQAAPPAAPG